MIGGSRQSCGRVLVVEDDPDIRAGVAELLRDEGWVVAEAANGEEGLAAARAEAPDVLILDMTMPVMDGVAFLERRAMEPSLARIPVVVLTARRPAPEVPGGEVVLKPFDLDVLLAAVERQLAGRTGAPAAAAAP